MGHRARRAGEAVGGSSRWRYRIEKHTEDRSWKKGTGVTEKWGFASKNNESWTNNPKCMSG